MTPYPEWFRQLRTYYASNSARMFVLHFNIDDYVLNPYASDIPITRVIPLLESYGRHYVEDGKGAFSACFRYSHSLDIVVDDQSDVTLVNIYRAIFGAAIGGMIGQQAIGTAGGLLGAAGGAALATAGRSAGGDRTSADIFEDARKQIGELNQPHRILRILERVLRSPQHRSLVIIEHVENLAPREMPQPDQMVNAEILKRLATDYEFRATDNLCILITRDLQAIDPGIYAPGTNCFPIQIDLPNDDERSAFLEFMDAEVVEEQAVSNGGLRRMRRTLISGLADIDSRLHQQIQRMDREATRATLIKTLARLTKGFRLVEIDHLNRQVRAQFAIDNPALLRAGTFTQPSSGLSNMPGAGTAAPGSSSLAIGAFNPGGSSNSLVGGVGPGSAGGQLGRNNLGSPSIGLAPQASATSLPAPTIRLDDIKEHKRRAIEEQSGGLLEIVDVKRGFDAIGGMTIVKEYLKTVSKRVLKSAHDSRYNHLIPRGIILAGPPGTGKTIIAESLALESNLNMVKLRNIRQQWVGASERNLNRAFEIIRALSPILVFVDEIDQAFGSRGLGGSNDAGTSERIFGQILEFIGDDRNRGRVIWVAATNRPDVIDAALLRRFDRIIPCLLPTPDEQLMILEALPKTIDMLRYEPQVEQLIAERSVQISDMLASKQGLVPTGAVIESIARRAVERAGDRQHDAADDPAVSLEDLRTAIADYRSNANMTEYDYQSLLAIRACNFYSVMSVLPDREPFTTLIEPRGTRLETTDPDGMEIPEYWREHIISYTQLEYQTRQHRVALGSALREEGRV